MARSQVVSGPDSVSESETAFSKEEKEWQKKRGKKRRQYSVQNNKQKDKFAFLGFLLGEQFSASAIEKEAAHMQTCCCMYSRCHEKKGSRP